MARVAAVFDDLLLGSNVLGMLRAAGHEAQLTTTPGHDAQVLIVDLAASSFDGVALAQEHIERGARTIGVHSHVHPEQRERALAGGFHLVVPRSRMAREGAALVDRVLGDGAA